MACLKTLPFAAACDLETCTNKAFATLAGGFDILCAAYAPSLCYICFGVSNSTYTQAYFYKYNVSTNAAELVFTLPVGMSEVTNMVWDPINKLFVGYVIGGGMYRFDPQSLQFQTAADSFYNPIWEPFNSKIYAEQGNNVVTVDPLAMNTTVLGSVGASLYELTYSPLTNCLYGGWKTGISGGLAKFDLNTNVGDPSIIPGFYCTTQCWDSDRNLLITNSDSSQYVDIDVGLESILATHSPPTNTTVTWKMTYVPTLKKAFGQGWFYPPTYDPIGNGGVTSYHTPDGVTKAEYFVHSYSRGFLIFKDKSAMLLGYDSYGADPGFQRVCLT